MALRKAHDGPVYSSEHGRMCAQCAKPISACACAALRAPAGGDGYVRVRRESKGRGGKMVTVLIGVPLAAADLATFAKELRRRFGVGGSVKDHDIELQGDHSDRVVPLLQARGWKVKRAGG